MESQKLLIFETARGFNLLYRGISFYVSKEKGWTRAQLEEIGGFLDKVMEIKLERRY